MKARRLISIAAVVVPALLVAALVLNLRVTRPPNDDHDPDYARYSAIFADLRERSGTRGLREGAVIELAHLNGGDWTTACFFGGYGDPVSGMQEIGASVSEKDDDRGMVPESDVAVAYVDPRNRAHFIHFREGIGVDGQSIRKCVSKPETKIVLDAYS